MAYSTGNFQSDAEKTARTLHVAYLRAKYLLTRWYAGMNTEFPNEGDGVAMNNLMNRVSELVADYEANGSGKLNTVLAMSNVTLPGDN